MPKRNQIAWSTELRLFSDTLWCRLAKIRSLRLRKVCFDATELSIRSPFLLLFLFSLLLSMPSAGAGVYFLRRIFYSPLLQVVIFEFNWVFSNIIELYWNRCTFGNSFGVSMCLASLNWTMTRAKGFRIIWISSTFNTSSASADEALWRCCYFKCKTIITMMTSDNAVLH